jgi:hypothetical protein
MKLDRGPKGARAHLADPLTTGKRDANPGRKSRAIYPYGEKT